MKKQTDQTLPNRKRNCAIRLLTGLVMISMVLCLFAGCGSGGEYSGSVHKRLIKYLQKSDHEKANKLAQNYQITDKEQAMEILLTIDEGQEQTFPISIYYFLPVIDSITCTDSKVIARMDEDLYSAGMKWFRSDFELDRVGDMWSRCSEGSKGRAYYDGFSGILGDDPVGGALIVAEYLDDNNTKETIQYNYRDYLKQKEYTNVQDYMDDMMAVSILFGDDHAASMNAFSIPSSENTPHPYLHETQYDINYADTMAYGMILEYEELSQTLPAALTNATGSKLLVLDRITIAGTNEVKLGIDSFMMKALPEQFLPKTLEEVGYVMLIDYGLEQDGIWYAGTTTVTLYNVQSGEPIFTSETLTGTYDETYFGKSTNVIFGSYPDATEIIKEAVSAIN